MANIRKIPRLDEKAFDALLRYRTEMTPHSEAEYEVLLQHKFKKEIPIFLQCIADGNQPEIEEFLKESPELAELACGTVTTFSKDTFENVTAIQLAYLLEDEKIGKLLFQATNNPERRKKLNQQLAQKISEVEDQEAHFKKYDLTAIAKAIKNDQHLRATGKASHETEKAFAKFKDYFQPKVVQKGRPFNMADLQQAYALYHKNWIVWNYNQLVWFLHNVIRLLLGRVSASYAQAFSQGLKAIVENNETVERRFKLNDEISYRYNPSLSEDSYDNFSYYTCCHSPTMKDGSFVDIHTGSVGEDGYPWWGTTRTDGSLKKYIAQKKQDWNDLINNFKADPESYASNRGMIKAF